MDLVFSYTNYRVFIKDFFSEQKKANKHFSHAYFAQKAGFKSRSFILKVINGEKGLARSSVFQVAAAIGLGKKEQEYFTNLVFFNEAKTSGEKEYYFKRMSMAHKSNKTVLLHANQYKYFSKWFYAALRELVTFIDFKDDFSILAKMFNPPISKKQACDGVGLLLELGFIQKHENKYIQTDATLSTGDEVQSIALQNFHKENLRLAAEAIDRVPRELRDISSVTVGTNHKGFEEIKKEIQFFRKRILDILITHQPIDRVYQFNFQLFPVSNVTKGAR
jgi:uncharacterized protein (TIGR02147 family)